MTESRNLDRTDCEIIRLLRNNARLSNKALAAKIGLAPSSCLTRVRRLEASGAVTGYHAEVNPKAVGVTLQAMIAVQLRRHSEKAVTAFRKHALALDEVIQLYHVGGNTDFLVHVWVRDTEHLRELAMTAFTARDEVLHIETGLIFEHATSKALPFYLAMDEDD